MALLNRSHTFVLFFSHMIEKQKDDTREEKGAVVTFYFFSPRHVLSQLWKIRLFEKNSRLIRAGKREGERWNHFHQPRDAAH